MEEDAEGVLSFDFEGGLDAGPAATAVNLNSSSLIGNDPSAGHNGNNLTTAAPVGGAGAGADAAGVGGAANSQGHPAMMGGRRSYRQTVCRHWLRSLCMKGDACGFLHQYDKSRMPVCRFFRMHGECREQDCVYKHTNEDIKECNM